jgi:phosphatidate cytidylyltransferase
MFKTRLLSGIVLIAVTIALMVNGGYPLFYTIMLLSLIGLFELYRTMKLQFSVLAIIGYLGSILLDILILDVQYQFAMLWLGVILLIMSACYVFTFPKYHIHQFATIFFGLIYVTLLLSFVFQVRYLSGGILLVWLIFIGAWGSDTCAYCVGKLLGKHELPSHLHQLSPHKTVEGCVGGILGAALIGFIYAVVFYRDKNFWWLFAVIGALSAFISQIGDLTASAIKRNQDIKDYGKLIPGHGGILDRFDSILFTGPVVYIIYLIYATWYLKH